jgi:hypothetical protein
MKTMSRRSNTVTPIDRWRRVACAVVTMATASLAAPPLLAQATPEPRPAAHVWLDRAGEPLPLQTHEEILEYLRTAEVIDRKPIPTGVAGAQQILMDRDGLRVRGVFRTVDETQRGPFENLPRSFRRVRDAAIFECAAYQLSQELGLSRVPPTVWREIDGTDGSVQIWLEGAMMQDEFLEQADDPPDVEQWNLQKRVLFVFDALIANIDRNQGNILVGREGMLWWIDHTRTFAQSRDLLGRDKVTRCSRDLWTALRNLDEASTKQRLEPFLRKGEIRALLRRRGELVKHIEKLIAAEGEAAVLFDLDPPTD